MKKYISFASNVAWLIVLGLLSVMPLCSAFTFKQSEQFDLKIPCIINEAPCGKTSAICNITIVYPNGTFLLSDKKMTGQNGGIFNYSFNSSVIGEHPTTIFCTEKGLNGTSTFDININSLGLESTDSRKDAANRGVYFLFGIGALFFVGFLFTEKWIFKWTFFCFALLFVLFGINVLSLTIYNDIGKTNIGAIFDQLAAASFMLVWFVLGIMLFMWVLATVASVADRTRMKQAEAVGSIRNDYYK